MTDYIKGILAELEEEYEVDYKADLIVQACNFDGTPGEIVGRWHQWCCRDDDKFRATSWSEEDEWCDDDKVADAALNYLYDHLNDEHGSWYSDGFGDGLVIVGSRTVKTVYGRDYVFDLDILVETREKEDDDEA